MTEEPILAGDAIADAESNGIRIPWVIRATPMPIFTGSRRNAIRDPNRKTLTSQLELDGI